MKQTWHNFYYDVQDVPITNNIINGAVEEFWVRVLNIYKKAIRLKVKL